MANYTVIRQKMSSYGKAAGLLPQLQQIYQQSAQVSAAIALFQAGTDPDFNAALGVIFTAEERAQLVQMLTHVNNLHAAWTANHSTLLNTTME